MRTHVQRLGRAALVIVLCGACGSTSRALHTNARARPPAEASTTQSAAVGSIPYAEAWREAAQRFRSGGAWSGADGAYSIALGPTRVLWLFADTFIDPSADGSRENGPNQFIRNSVAIQSGLDANSAHDLARSSMTFHWRTNPAGTAHSFFADIDTSERWVWPLHGTRLADGTLLLFRMQVVHSTAAFGFAIDGWDAVAIDDPMQEPERWQPRSVAAVSRSLGRLIGSSVLVHGEFLYAYAVEDQARQHAVFVVRWPLAALRGLSPKALSDPEWYTQRGFVAQHALSKDTEPSVLFADGQVEFSVHYDAARARFVEIQMAGLFVSDPRTQLVMRTAARPEGPWSPPTAFYRPPEHALPNARDLAAYAGKAHPEQLGGDLVTYVVNDVTKPTPSDAVYYPQTLRLRYRPAANSGTHAGTSPATPPAPVAP